MTNLVVSLELSKKVEDLGCPQVSKFYYCISQSVVGGWEIKTDEEIKRCCYPVKKKYSAYLSDEVLRWLPYRLRMEDYDYWLKISKSRFGYDIRYVSTAALCNVFKGNDGIKQDDTLPNALALMLIYLLEHNLLKAENLL
jgi:hypothetical protein